jgi:hypothetical protein
METCRSKYRQLFFKKIKPCCHVNTVFVFIVPDIDSVINLYLIQGDRVEFGIVERSLRVNNQSHFCRFIIHDNQLCLSSLR